MSVVSVVTSCTGTFDPFVTFLRAVGVEAWLGARGGRIWLAGTEYGILNKVKGNTTRDTVRLFSAELQSQFGSVGGIITRISNFHKTRFTCLSVVSVSYPVVMCVYLLDWCALSSCLLITKLFYHSLQSTHAQMF